MLSLIPMTLREANAFVAEHHRHHEPRDGLNLFAAGVARGGIVVGVAIVSRANARMLCDDFTAEVTRVALDEARPLTPHVNRKGEAHVADGACSMLYAACWRACRALGWRRLVTYILPEEGGASLRGAGWKCIGEAGGGSWDRAERPRVDTHPTQTKLRWEIAC